MEHLFPFLFRYVPVIPVQKIEHADPPDKTVMHAFRMKHSMHPYIHALRGDFPRRQIRLHHGRPYRLHTPEQHHAKQPVFKYHISCRQHKKRPRQRPRQLLIPRPKPKHRYRQVRQNEETKIGKIRQERISKQRGIQFHGRLPVNPSQQEKRQRYRCKRNPERRKHI